MITITPKAIDDIFNDDILNALPSNNKINHGVGCYKHAQTKKDNKQFGKTMSNIASNRDAEYKQRHQQGVEQRDNTYQAECNARPEVRERISKSMKGKEKTAEHKEKVAAKTRERAKPVITPWGIFRSGKLAGDAYNELNNVSNGRNRVSHHTKRGTEGYRFITLEEYIMLTGKDVL